MQELGFTQDATPLTVDEDLPNFFKAVKNSERDWYLKEHYYFESNYNLSIISDKQVRRLESTDYVKRPIQGIHFYLPLNNPDYRSAFNYISPARANRGSLLVSAIPDDPHIYEQSDLVKIFLNFAFIDDELAKKIKFERGIHSAVKEWKKENNKKKTGGGWFGSKKVLDDSDSKKKIPWFLA